MVRKLALAMAFMVMTFYKGAFALGLGEIELQSALGQPLSAEIELLSARPGELDQAMVKLASREAFARAGLERLEILSDLKFEVTARPGGENYLRVTSSKPVNEPFLSFLVELAWPRGRLMREYTLLLDPPVFVPEAPAPLAAPMAEPQPESRPMTAPEPVEAAPVTAAPEVATSQVNAGEYGPTRRDETLWEIARRLRPGSDITMNQMMQALLRANPEAFYRGNINNLKAGYVLRVPTREEILSISPAEALAETRRHTRLWREYRNRMAEMPLATRPAADESGQEPDQVSGQADGTGAQTATESGKLEIVAPEKDAGAAGSGVAGEQPAQAGGADGEGEPLRKEVQLLTEAAEAQSQENKELRQRIKELEKQLETLTRLVTLRNQEMASLEKKAATPAAKTTPDDAVLPEDEDTPEALSDQLVDMIDDLLASPVALLAVVLLIALLAFIAWMILRRRRMRASHYQEGMLGAEQTAVAAGATAAVAEAAGEEAAVGEAGGSELKGAGILESEAAEDSVSSFSDFPLSGMGDIHSEVSEVDPLSEADVYIAYGRYQQAEELLQEALAAEPDRHDLHAKLLEVYHAAKDTPAFEKEAAKLAEALGDRNAPMWLKVAGMGRELNPDNPLFQEDASTPAAVEDAGETAAAEDSATPSAGVDELDDLAADLGDLDLGGLDLGGDREATDETDGGPDLDLGGLEQASNGESGQGEAAGDALGEGLDLDLDLGDFDLGGEAERQPLAETPETAGDDGVYDLGDGSDALELDLGALAAEGSETTGEAAGSDDKDLGDVTLDLGEAELGEFDLEAGADEDEDTGGEEVAADEDLLGGLDEVGTKLDLARAYIDMGDNEGARSILQEVLEEGGEEHRQEAQALIDQMG